MISELSPRNLLYLEQMVANGSYPSISAALDAAFQALKLEMEHPSMKTDCSRPIEDQNARDGKREPS